MTQGVKYIGSKAALTSHITEIVQRLCPRGTLIDVMTGTTRVAQAFKALGWSIITSDLAWASECYAQAFLSDTPRDHLIALEPVLNALPGQNGWITRTYCDVPNEAGGTVRVWQPKNGRRADAIREYIQNADLTDSDKKVLVASLILALDKVDNTVGVQQAYLKDWCERSNNDMTFSVPVVQGPPCTHKHLTGDCLQLDYPPADVAYVDPPYSAHSYGTYYHIWDSIARWDKPPVLLTTHRRADRVGADQAMRSLWNSKKTAGQAFEQLFSRLPVKYIIVSYNNESLLTLTDLLAICNKTGMTTVHELPYRRHIMSQIGNAEKNPNKKKTNIEYLIVIQKHA